jgi:hypothetical protein
MAIQRIGVLLSPGLVIDLGIKVEASVPRHVSSLVENRLGEF